MEIFACLHDQRSRATHQCLRCFSLAFCHTDRGRFAIPSTLCILQLNDLEKHWPISASRRRPRGHHGLTIIVFVRTPTASARLRAALASEGAYAGTRSVVASYWRILDVGQDLLAVEVALLLKLGLLHVVPVLLPVPHIPLGKQVVLAIGIGQLKSLQYVGTKNLK